MPMAAPWNNHHLGLLAITNEVVACKLTFPDFAH